MGGCRTLRSTAYVLARDNDFPSCSCPHQVTLEGSGFPERCLQREYRAETTRSRRKDVSRRESKRPACLTRLNRGMWMARAHDQNPFTRLSGTPSRTATEVAAVIPFPIGGRQRDGEGADSTWRYEQDVRGGRRRFSGEVTYVGGAEGERRRKELAVVMADLLRWAEQRHSRTDQIEPREDDRAA